MLSLAWGPPVPRQPSQKKPQTAEDSSDEDEEEDEWSDSWLVTGGSDSSLRKWDIATGRVLERMGVDKVRGERTLVWTVGVLGLVFVPSIYRDPNLFFVKRWYNCFRRLNGHGEVLGFADMHSATFLPSTRRRRIVHDNQSSELLFLSVSYLILTKVTF